MVLPNDATITDAKARGRCGRRHFERHENMKRQQQRRIAQRGSKALRTECTEGVAEGVQS